MKQIYHLSDSEVESFWPNIFLSFLVTPANREPPTIFVIWTATNIVRDQPIWLTSKGGFATKRCRTCLFGHLFEWCYDTLGLFWDSGFYILTKIGTGQLDANVLTPLVRCQCFDVWSVRCHFFCTLIYFKNKFASSFKLIWYAWYNIYYVMFFPFPPLSV